MTQVFSYTKDYTRYSYVVNYKTRNGNFRRVKGLPDYETYEEAEIAAKHYAGTAEKYYVHRNFVR